MLQYQNHQLLPIKLILKNASTQKNLKRICNKFDVPEKRSKRHLLHLRGAYTQPVIPDSTTENRRPIRRAMRSDPKDCAYVTVVVHLPN